MRFSPAAVLVAAGLVSASPIEKRVTTPTVNDGIILNYALTLEYLERSFYEGGVAKFSNADFVAAGFPDPFYANLKTITSDEETHVAFLNAGLTAAGVTPTVQLQYSFPYTDPKSFITLSSVLEGVGVSAYLGAAAFIANPNYLTAAGDILTIEARHTAYVRNSLAESPFPNPFDTPLDFNQVYSLAAQFITGGTSPVTLPFTPFPKLAVAPATAPLVPGSSILTFTGAFANAKQFGITASTPVYAVFFSGLSKLPVQAVVSGNDFTAKLPTGVSGQVYVVLSKSSSVFADEQYVAGVGAFEVPVVM